ncbi:unnamed protein product [Aphanomyces euteiches]|uniref:Uncharacterized protein n=1 Tax=Aphanomyces euteiches TaxID=100861 RepID=A0A6G0W9X7_9STRA|nr:hypothetical protein Ae201684_017230 [Aphanomyces euteiches]KAH9101071.1 hypothetical protein Ae201684P_007259 [Aphanomyces euteiches]KAH9188160.1 hypothetical protein AeNC1_009865 [Aphanomyces euteiches]
MKKSKVSISALSLLSVDIVVAIAFYIPDASDLFAFLEALRPYNMLGPLEILLELDQQLDRSSFLWPTLRLPVPLGPWSFSYESIAKFYSTVAISNLNEMAWLKTHLHPKAKLAWFLDEFPATMDILDDYWAGRITQLSVCLRGDSISSTTKVLHRLHNLVSLEVYDSPNINLHDDELRQYHAAWDDIFELAAKSNHLVELKISPEFHSMLALNTEDLIDWFDRQPVRVFECTWGDWLAIDFDLKQELYQAMFNCPTMDTLRLNCCRFRDVDFSQLTFSMRSMQFKNCFSDTNFITQLATRLKGSSVVELEFSDYRDDSVDGLECLLQVLPQTSIIRLKMDGLPFQSLNLHALLPLLENCTLKSLSLLGENFSSAFANALAASLQNNKTICELNLYCRDIAIADMRLLIQSMRDPSRGMLSKTIHLKISHLDTLDALALETLLKYAAHCGICLTDLNL